MLNANTTHVKILKSKLCEVCLFLEHERKRILQDTFLGFIPPMTRMAMSY